MLIEYPARKPGFSFAIPNSVATIGSESFQSCTLLTNIIIPNGVTSIGTYAFVGCTNLISLTIPGTLTNLGNYAFQNCSGLAGIYFQGNSPGLGGTNVFANDTNTTVYFLPGTSGWASNFAGRPTTLWLLANPAILNFEPTFGVHTNSFGFTISWATNINVVVEACTNLFNPVWQPLQTNTLTSGTAYFSDPQWTNYPGRFYRLRSP
jgi:hypothetical protein